MKIKYIFILPLLLSVGLLSSCDKDDDPKIEHASTYPVSGDWTVTYKVETSTGVFEDIYHVGESKLLIYNTAADKGEQVWVDDHGNFWDYKVKSNVRMNDLTFSGSELENESYESSVTIANGKVIKNGTKVRGISSDSIYFQVSFDDDDTPYGTIYHVSGHRSTGFE